MIGEHIVGPALRRYVTATAAATAVGLTFLLPGEALAVTTRTVTVDTTPPLVSAVSHAVPVTGPIGLTSTEVLHGVTTGPKSTSFSLVPASGGPAITGAVTGHGKTFVLRPSSRLVTGEHYTLLVAAGITDRAGNQAQAPGDVTTARVAEDTSGAWTFTGHWQRHRSSTAMGHTFKEGAKGDAAEVAVSGASVSVYGCKAPTLGSETISVSGSKPVTVKLTNPYTHCGVVLWSGTLPKGVAAVKVAVTQGVGDVDAVKVTPERRRARPEADTTGS
jgi:hypothetical protein